MITDAQKIAQLEKQVQQLITQTKELNQKIMFLERENNRRRNDANQLATAINNVKG